MGDELMGRICNKLGKSGDDSFGSNASCCEFHDLKFKYSNLTNLFGRGYFLTGSQSGLWTRHVLGIPRSGDSRGSPKVK